MSPTVAFIASDAMSKKTQRAISCIYLTMNANKWTNLTEGPIQVLPELELSDADYEAATKAWQNLDDCFFEVVFLHEVAARHCRERQLTELLRRQTVLSPERALAKENVKQWMKPTPISQFKPFEAKNPTPISLKRRP